MKRLSADVEQPGERIVRRGIVACLLTIALLAVPRVPFAPDVHAQTGVSLARGWQHVPISAPGFPQGPIRVAAGGRGLVAFAPGYQIGPGYQPVPTGLWSSTDGRRWQSLPSPRFRRGELPGGFYAAGRILVITGYAGNSPRIWASHDAGATWHQSPAHLRITALATGGDGAVAFGQADVSQPISVWTSADGLSWRRLPQASGVFASAQVYSVARGSRGLVAGGAVVRPGLERAGIWTSRDGGTWRQVPNYGGIFGNGSEGATVYHVAAGPRGMLAIGQRLNRGPNLPVVWASPDGVHWQRRTLPSSYPSLYFGQVAPWRDGFVQLNNEGGETAVWSSSDGLTWVRVGSDELFGGSGRVWSVTGFREGVVAVGSFAPHPQPACLGTLTGELRTFQPAVFLWSPAASALAPPLTVDRTDPRTLKLLPADLAASLHLFDYDGTSYRGSYVNLCAADRALGPHRAYSLGFPQRPDEGTFGDWALSIYAAGPTAARTAFRHAGPLLRGEGGDGQQQHELPAGVGIGEETRVFRLQVRTVSEGVKYSYTKFAVIWRKGRVIGVVVTYRRHEAVVLAKRQFAHLAHP